MVILFALDLRLLHWHWCIKVEGLPCFKMAALLTHSF